MGVCEGGGSPRIEERGGHTLGSLLQALFQIHNTCPLPVTQHLAQVCV